VNLLEHQVIGDYPSLVRCKTHNNNMAAFQAVETTLSPTE